MKDFMNFNNYTVEKLQPSYLTTRTLKKYIRLHPAHHFTAKLDLLEDSIYMQHGFWKSTQAVSFARYAYGETYVYSLAIWPQRVRKALKRQALHLYPKGKVSF